MQIRQPFPHVDRLAPLTQACLLAGLTLAACTAWPRQALAQEALPPGTRPPERIVYMAPSYPERALRLEASGDVTLQFTVDVNGQPRGIRVVDATAPQLFARTAVLAARRWRYEPLLIAGKPMAMPVRVVVRFAYL